MDRNKLAAEAVKLESWDEFDHHSRPSIQITEKSGE